MMISETRVLVTCALSEGGPGLYFDEHNGGNSTFVTRKPTSGSSAFGVASSCKVGKNIIEIKFIH